MLSDIDDDQFEAELDLSLEARTKIMQEENDKKVAKKDLDKQQRNQLKQIVTKKRAGSAIKREEPAIQTNNKRFEEEKKARDIDSSLDSDEFDAEIRDKVRAEGVEGDSEQDDGENGNTDLKYYDIMDANDKLQTLTNRSKDL